MKKLSIVVPCYNEAKNIPLILERFDEVIMRDDLEVMLVDNGSYDETQQVLGEILPSYPFAKMVRVEKNQGYGFGILTGLRAASGEYLAWTHADLQTDPHDVIKAMEIIEKRGMPKNVFVKGLRRGRTAFDVFFTFGMSCFETVFLQKTLWDINAQPNIFHRSFFEQWNKPPHDFSLDLYALYMAKKLKLEIVRFNVEFSKRLHGQASNASFKQKFNLTKRTLAFTWKLKWEARL